MNNTFISANALWYDLYISEICAHEAERQFAISQELPLQDKIVVRNTIRTITAAYLTYYADSFYQLGISYQREKYRNFTNRIKTDNLAALVQALHMADSL